VDLPKIEVPGLQGREARFKVPQDFIPAAAGRFAGLEDAASM
jgi:hypothetical protein